jgi:anti-sigma factor RsiW
MNDPLDNLLDARLREEAPYIDDAGFTARVMKQLPRRRWSWSTQRAFIIFAATLVSVVIAYFASGEGMFVQDAFARMSGLQPLQLLLLVFACGTGMTIAGLWAALARRGTTV